MAENPDPKILKKINNYLSVLRTNHMQFDSVWLFGSFARHQAEEDSDIDVALVMPDVKTKFFKEVELTRFRRQIDSRIEPHIINAEDMDSPFYKEVVESGIRIA